SIGYFKAMGLSILTGRDFDATDNSDSTAHPVVIVNETAAKTIFHTANPVGKRVQLGGNGPFIAVIGVVRDVRGATLRDLPRPQVFLTTQQAPQGGGNLVVQYDGPVGPVVSEVQRIVRGIDKSIPLFDVQTIEDVLEKASVGDQFTM